MKTTGIPVALLDIRLCFLLSWHSLAVRVLFAYVLIISCSVGFRHRNIWSATFATCCTLWRVDNILFLGHSSLTLRIRLLRHRVGLRTAIRSLILVIVNATPSSYRIFRYGTALRQAVWVDPTDRIRRVGINVEATHELGRIRADEPPSVRIVVSKPVVAEPGLFVLVLPLKPDGGTCLRARRRLHLSPCAALKLACDRAARHRCQPGAQGVPLGSFRYWNQSLAMATSPSWRTSLCAKGMNPSFSKRYVRSSITGSPARFPPSS